MIIKELTPAGLDEYINSEEFQHSKVLPISKHRAISQIHNPKVGTDDIILLIAYQKSELVGYLGVLADEIHLNGNEHKVGWLSCIWTSDQVRGQGVAKQLLSAALLAWDNKILATEYTDVAKALYTQSGAFVNLTTLIGRRGYLRFNLHELLPPKGFPKTLTGLLKLADTILNILNSIRLSFWKSSLNSNDPNLEYISEIDNETKEFIEKRNCNELIKRSAAELNWITHFPWVLNSLEDDANAPRYHFTSSDKEFKTSSLKLRNKDGLLIAFIMLVVRGKNLKIPYCYFDGQYTDKLVQVIYNLMFEKGLNRVTTYNQNLTDYFKSHRTPFILHKQMQRGYLISKDLAQKLNAKDHVRLQDGSGDCVFT